MPTQAWLDLTNQACVLIENGCDEESTVFHVGEELLEGLLAGAV